jgi:hypothetical protein
MIESVCTGFVFGRRPAGSDRPISLLNSILRWVRQRAFVVLDPCQIARIDPAVARLASEKLFDLMNAAPVGALAEQRPARSRLINWHDRCHQHLSKKSGPRNCSRGPILYGARGRAGQTCRRHALDNVNGIGFRERFSA